MREIIEAALRRQRVSVLVGLSVALGMGVFSVWARTAGAGVEVLTALPPLFFAGAALREVVRRPGTEGLRVDEGGRTFFAPPRSGLSYLPVLCGYFAYSSIDSYTRSADDPLRWLFVGVYGVLSLALATVYWRRVPVVELTAEGISSGAPRRQLVVPWDALGRGGPVGPGRGLYLRLPVARPELVRRGGWGPRRGAQLPVRELATAPTLLSAAIKHYAAHPEHRVAIGTRAEYDRLPHALTDGH